MFGSPDVEDSHVNCTPTALQIFKQVAFKIQGTRTHTRQMWIGPI